jgi:hypothetical protein
MIFSWDESYGIVGSEQCAEWLLEGSAAFADTLNIPLVSFILSPFSERLTRLRLALNSACNCKCFTSFEARKTGGRGTPFLSLGQ